MSTQQVLYRQIDPTAWPQGISPFNKVVCALVVGAVGVAIVETERALTDAYPGFFYGAEWFFFIAFSIEYVLRIYVAPLNSAYAGRWGRIRYVFSLWAIIDLLALLPFLLLFIDGDTAYYLRVARLLRILRLSRLGRFSRAWQMLWQAVVKRRYELFLSGLVATMLLLVSSTFLYLFESDDQQAFGSIPKALWWSIVTLTTVGYGDVTPLTAAGKFFASITAVAGIGIVAMPTGILAAAFSDAFQEQNREEDEEDDRRQSVSDGSKDASPPRPPAGSDRE